MNYKILQLKNISCQTMNHSVIPKLHDETKLKLIKNYRKEEFLEVYTDQSKNSPHNNPE